MSIQTRKELLKNAHEQYKSARWNEKCKILDHLVAITGYRRKYAISLLNRDKLDNPSTGTKKRQVVKKKYDAALKQALLTIWHATNRICSKRLVPFIPDMLATLERCGHISLPLDVRNRLLEISPATVDRLLVAERQISKAGLSTTRPGSLLKKQIKIRTFADWNDILPGFLEGDLVAHCGDRVDGSFLNTFVLTDIASTWTEFFPLLRRCETDVIEALKIAQQLLPFMLLGLDTDNGSEFINYALLNFCEVEKITFTRARAYRKNDQAHVEEKNGSIIRRIIGYDRYEGLEAYNALAEIYAVLRLYVNFFQPSLKLLSKERNGSKLIKKYDKAKTPCQRLLASKHVVEQVKQKLKNQYEKLDPIELLKNLERLQENFWKHAWKSSDAAFTLMTIQSTSETENTITNTELAAPIEKILPTIKRCRHMNKPRKTKAPMTWRTRKDPFEGEWSHLRLQLELNPQGTAKGLLDKLIKEKPGQFTMKLLRTLQRRVAAWRMQQIKIYQEIEHKKIINTNDVIGKYISLTNQAVGA